MFWSLKGLVAALAVVVGLAGCDRMGGPMGMGSPSLGSSTYSPVGVSSGSNTGTYVGQKVADMRRDLTQLQGQIAGYDSELQSLRGSLSQSTNAYNGHVATIRSRLQVGTTPGNPILIEQWNGAQRELTSMGGAISEMTTLANKVAGLTPMATMLIRSIQTTYQVPGAVDEDHRQLRVLEDETNRTAVQIDRLQAAIGQDVSRQTSYHASERSNLSQLSLQIRSGQLGGSGAVAASVPGAPQSVASAQSLSSQQPLVIIRFDRPNVDYEQALYTAVSQALQRRPNASFDVVGVSPAGGNPTQVAVSTGETQRHAEGVVRSLTNMGFPPDRLTLSAMTSQATNLSEVHLYVR